MNIHPLTNKLLNLEGYEGKQVFFNGYVHKDQFNEIILTGYWEYSDGGEGGELSVWANIDEHLLEVDDFDGAGDLPNNVKIELDNLGVICNWD